MLTEEIINGNHDYDIDEDVLTHDILKVSEEIKQKPNFSDKFEFDPDVHLAFDETQTTKIHRLQDLGIKRTHCQTITDVAVVEPFPLFTEDAIEIMKWELFSNPDIIREYGRRVNLAVGSSSKDFQVSGFADNTPFIKAAISHPRTIQIMSKLAGLPLKIPHVYSMAHINASLKECRNETSVKTDEDLREKLREQNTNADNIPSSVSWHYDSTPLVCVLMLEAPSNMIGGETCLRMGNEEIFRVDGPRKGHATLLQGRVVKHIATKPLNNADRISLVVSFIPEEVDTPDTTVAVSESPSATPSFLNDKFYPNYVNYKFERIEQRLRKFRINLMENYEKKEKFDQVQTIDFCKDIEKYLFGVYKDFEAISDAPYPPKLFSTPYSQL
ncbi:hypothetical protein PGUG_02284 [Meyerozyma guilliermondii ATCC 6260]|uniref:Fe2OG dioxygenase domain-containing protein n=1 Tax=Meyerozyma guilliermondii (strain ATCC 6260 / CBS 566 / DSM 6381 / JCM 1539 / NBRC 10279 / NRRL Y-324) TaxID=294746 RepID=A5DG83_PICGU|nr:uncharacterized protein PGUG_02284 [Meyerozyma guilliermondii ATCC 6260]EDK38186.2 hypothetical protein PGUG_02284 [Meyerozyma guilliermondii ATCC 6260]